MIVVAGVLTLLLGVALLMCIWRRCCRGGAVEPTRGPAEAVVYTSSHAEDRPFVSGSSKPIKPQGTASAGQGAAAPGPEATLSGTLRPDVARMAPAAVLKMYSEQLRVRCRTSAAQMA